MAALKALDQALEKETIGTDNTGRNRDGAFRYFPIDSIGTL